jgi:hypothetical protein
MLTPVLICDLDAGDNAYRNMIDAYLIADHQIGTTHWFDPESI